MSTRRRARGFTLIELLVGLVLLSLISVGVYESLRSSVRIWEATTVRSDHVARVRSVEAFVRRHLSQAAFIVTGRGSRAAVTFTGGRDSVTFISELPAYLGGGGLYDFTLAFERQGEAQSLVVRFRRSTLGEDEDTTEEEPDTTVLLAEVDDGEFEYYGTPRGRGAASWHESWEDAERLPELVAVQWSTPRGGDWPRLLIEPRADAVSARLGARGATLPQDDDDDGQAPAETEPVRPPSSDGDAMPPSSDGDAMPPAERE